MSHSVLRFKLVSSTLALTCFAIVFASSDIAKAGTTQVSWRKDFRKAAQEASRSKKPLLVKVSASWCHFCHKMQKETYSDETIAQHVNGCFIPVAVDADADKQIVDAIGVEGLPTTVIISPELKIIKKITGFQKPKELDLELDTVCTIHQISTAPKSPKPATPQRKTDQADFAFQGYCLVSLLDERKLRRGSPQQTVSGDKVSLCFVSEAHRERFLEDAKRYWPAGGGLCAVSWFEERKEREGNPEFGVIYRDRLWFFADEKRRDRFTAAPEDFLRAEP